MHFHYNEDKQPMVNVPRHHGGGGRRDRPRLLRVPLLAALGGGTMAKTAQALRASLPSPSESLSKHQGL